MAKNVRNKIQLELLAACDYAIVSKENKLRILGIFDQIFVEKTPSQHPKMFIVGTLKGEPNYNYTVNLKIEGPSGKEILPTQELKNNFGPNGTSNIIAELGNLPVSDIGVYKISLSADGKLLGTRELKVFTAAGGVHGKEKAGKYTN